jgi:enterochelin esterase-like enzyme
MIRLILRFPLFLIVIMTLGCRAAADIPIPAASATVPSPSTGALATPTLALTDQPTATMTGQATAAAPQETATPLPPTPSVTPIVAPAETTPPPTPCAEPGGIEIGGFDSVVAGESMRYRIYLPPCYGLDGHVYPALYMFGGNIHDDAIWDRLGLDEAAEAAIAAGEIPPLLIVMPDNGWLANTTTSGPNSYEGFVIAELIPHIEANYCAWSAADGRAVGGISRGGYWSLMMAFRRPDLFGSVGAHSPALIDSHAGPAEDPVITGATSDLGALRIWVDIGERDPYLVEAQPLHEALVSAAVTHEWHVNEGTHDETYWRANLGNYLRWYSDGWRIDRAELPDCPDRQ